MTPAAGAEAGRAARAAVPRGSHEGWEPAAERLDPVVILRRQERQRLPELLPLRHARMLASPFAFFRGSAAIMAADLATTPVTGLRVQLCGDAHLSNFGGFAAPDRTLVFDLNDFDETLPGPWEWDVKRLAASAAVACRELGFDEGAAVAAAVRSYRLAMREFVEQRTLEVWYARLEIEPLLAGWVKRSGSARRRRLDRELDKTKGKNSLRALTKLTRDVDGEPRIVSEPPLLVPVEELLPAGDGRRPEQELPKLVAAYRESLPDDRRRLIDGYRPVHYARKVVGVGSVGTDAWIVLLLGRDASDPLFLQVKEARRSALEPFTTRSRYATHGRRVVEGQRLMQAASDVLLGWLPPTRGLDNRVRHYYVRQLWDAKGSVELTDLDASDFTDYARVCGWTLARAHARAGDRAAIAAYLGGGDRFDRAIASFAAAYADQNERDYERLVEAVRVGKLPAETS